MLNVPIDDFISLFNQGFCDFDGYYGNQCVDLAQFWNRVLGGRIFTGNAKDIFNQPQEIYSKVSNTPTGVPVKGDVVVWNSSFNGGPGHVGISTGKGDINRFEVLEQNDPTNKFCQLKTYNYNYVLGWLHPKVLPTGSGNNSYGDALRQIKNVVAQTGV